METEEQKAAREAAEAEVQRLAEEEANKVAPELDENGDPIVPTAEPWMSTDDPGEQTPGDPSKNVPVSKYVHLKKDLRGKISDRDAEIEKLRSENETLKRGPATPKILKRPVATDFRTDEDYEDALDQYYDNRANETFKRRQMEDTQTSTQRQTLDSRKEAVDKHYLRADELLEKSGIQPEIYKQADATVREAVEVIMPKLGDTVVDQIIAILGEGSEKVMFFLGRNPAALGKFQSLLTKDKTGMKAAVYLGQEKQRLTNPSKPRSNAPDPAAQINGDANSTVQSSALKKKYETAHKAGKTQLAYNLKQQARKAKVNVTDW